MVLGTQSNGEGPLTGTMDFGGTLSGREPKNKYSAFTVSLLTVLPGASH